MLLSPRSNHNIDEKTSIFDTNLKIMKRKPENHKKVKMDLTREDPKDSALASSFYNKSPNSTRSKKKGHVKSRMKGR